MNAANLVLTKGSMVDSDKYDLWLKKLKEPL